MELSKANYSSTPKRAPFARALSYKINDNDQVPSEMKTKEVY